MKQREVEPANVMLPKGGGKLMDFGVAKESGTATLATAIADMTMQHAKLTSEGMIVGTVQYMAPEQLEGKEADTRTEIFALGEMIYEMATGKPAFRGQNRAGQIAALLTTDHTPYTRSQAIAR